MSDKTVTTLLPYQRRRRMEDRFNQFCELKSGTEIDKLKMFVFAEMSNLQLSLEEVFKILKGLLDLQKNETTKTV